MVKKAEEAKSYKETMDTFNAFRGGNKNTREAHSTIAIGTHHIEIMFKEHHQKSQQKITTTILPLELIIFNSY
jgi:hypothetical protein